MTKNAYIGPNFAVLRPKFLFFGEGTKVLVLTYQKTNEAPRSHCFLVGQSTNMDQNRVAEVVRRHEEPSPKSLDSDENSNPFDFSFPSYSSFCKKERPTH